MTTMPTNTSPPAAPPITTGNELLSPLLFSFVAVTAQKCIQLCLNRIKESIKF